MNGNSLEVPSKRTKIKMNGLQACIPSPTLMLSFCCLSAAMRYSSGTGLFLIAMARGMVAAMEQAEPIMSGSSGPMKVATRKFGTVKARDETSTMGRMPLKALTPLPITKTIKKGERNMSRASISAVFAESDKVSVETSISKLLESKEANVEIGRAHV